MSDSKKQTLEERKARVEAKGRLIGEKTSRAQRKFLDKTIKVTTAASKKVSEKTALNVRKATGAEKYQQEAIQLNERLETALQNLIMILDEKEKEIALLRQRVKDLEMGR